MTLKLILAFVIAFAVLRFFITIPQAPNKEETGETLLQSAKMGLRWLKENPLVLVPFSSLCLY